MKILFTIAMLALLATSAHAGDKQKRSARFTTIAATTSARRGRPRAV